MHVERHIGDLDEIVEVVAQLHCRVPERLLSCVLFDPEVHCGSDEFFAHADSFLTPVAKIYPSCGDVFHLVGDFFGIRPGDRHAYRLHELSQAVAHVDLFLLVTDRSADNVRQDDPCLAAGWYLLFLVDNVIILFWIYQNAGLDQNRSLTMQRFKSVLILRKWFLRKEHLRHDRRHVRNVLVGENLARLAQVCL